jgi:uncharacterized protein YaiE (UPF0345 family)
MADFVLGRIKFVWKGSWAGSTAYIADDVVRYGGNAFIALANHTSSAAFETDLAANPTKWQKMVGGVEYKSDHANSTYYKVDDIVKYGPTLWRCSTAHTSSSAVLDTTKFTVFLPGLEFEDSWASGTQYQQGDIVTYGGYQYVAERNNIGVTPIDSGADWEIITTGYSMQGTWSASTVYKTGEVVQYGGNTYVFKVTTTAGQLPTNSSYADLVVEGVSLKGVWASGTAYKIGEVVISSSSTYRAKIDTTAGQAPGNEVDNTQWAVFVKGAPSGVFTTQGDTVIQGSAGPERLPIGRQGDRLRVNAAGNGLEYFEESSGNSFHVSPEGLDTNPGTETLPLKTIKKACQLAGSNGISQIKSITGGTGGTPGTYRNVSITGGSSTGATADIVTDGSSTPTITIINNGQGWSEGNTAIIAKAAIGNSTADINFEVDTVAGGDTIRVQSGTFEETFPIRIPPQVTLLGDSLRATKVEPATGNSTEALTIGTVGANDASRTPGTYTNVVATATSGDGVGLKVTVVIDGSSTITVTPTYGGCYFAVGDTISIADNVLGAGGGAALTAAIASVKANNVCSMLLTNNANYVSFFTFQGMTTGANVCSLDPSGAITTASPYMHNCTSVNTGTTGMMIDGNAHATGNKSMVANDFTQINTDGKGVSVINGGRAELVSVFTYYCDKGFNAETGGVIRALNCSNGYGEYGAFADGVSASETPDEVQLRGGQIRFQNLQGNIATATVAEGDTLTGATSGATATAIDVVQATRKIKVEAGNGRLFSPGEVVNVTGGSSYNFKVSVTAADLTDAATKTITGVTQANPAVVTSNGHGLNNGNKIVISGVVGMTQLNTNTYYVQNATTNTFSLSSNADPTATTNVDSSGFTAYGSAGTITPKTPTTGQTGFLFEVDSTSTLLSSATAIEIGSNLQFAGDAQYYRVTAITNTDTTNKQAKLAITPERTAFAPDNTEVDITKNFSNVRLTGHDFLSIGTGSFTDTNYPNSVGNTQPYDASRETTEQNGGRVYYTSTDQLGNFRVGSQFKIDQATGTATLNADAFDLSGLTELQLGSIGAAIGATINEFSTDGTLAGNSDTAVPTEQAVKTYVDGNSFSTGKGIAMAIVFG